MPNRPMEWPVAPAFDVVNQLAEDAKALALRHDLTFIIPCSKSSCWYNTGKEQECTRKPDDITPNNYSCTHYNDVFILLKEPIQPTMISMKILKSRKK